MKSNGIDILIDHLGGQIDELRAALASLTDRAEASGAITEDEANEYRALLERTRLR